MEELKNRLKEIVENLETMLWCLDYSFEGNTTVKEAISSYDVDILEDLPKIYNEMLNTHGDEPITENE